MFDINKFSSMDTKDKYDLMLHYLKSLITGNESKITKLANASALINAVVGRMNWCGFYLDNRSFLELGPFQGLPACTRIEYNRGVCGKAFTTKKSLKIDNVHAFEDHIACDSRTNSELVIPIIKDCVCLGVLDMDSEDPARFTDLELEYLEKAVEIISDCIF